jgi:hypothetical protein
MVITERIEFPATYVCGICLKPTLYKAGEHWQVCEEYHFTEARFVEFQKRDAESSRAAEKPQPKWTRPADDTFGMRG